MAGLQWINNFIEFHQSIASCRSAKVFVFIWESFSEISTRNSIRSINFIQQFIIFFKFWEKIPWREKCLKLRRTIWFILYFEYSIKQFYGQWKSPYIRWATRSELFNADFFSEKDENRAREARIPRGSKNGAERSFGRI